MTWPTKRERRAALVAGLLGTLSGVLLPEEAAANADKAIEDWKMSVLDREYLDNIQEDRVARFVSEIAKIQKEGSLAESATDVNYHTSRLS